MLDNMPLMDHKDLIRIANRAQTVRDHKAGPIPQQLFQRLLDQPFGARIHAAGRFVQDQQAWIGQRGARNRE